MLVIAAAPRRGLFRKKPTAYRLAAVQALAEAGTPPALVALERLAADDDREVRAAARRFTRQTASGGVPAVSE
jgi:HEAT repeat protein